MMKLTISNADNSKTSVDLVRYFKFKTDCYLIYTLGEVDEKNYKKLYLVRIMEELGFPVVQTIRNDADWANMQGIVKKVLKELKKNKKNLTEDLDPKEIEGIKVVEPRFFKLESSLVDILSSNYSFDESSLTLNNVGTSDFEGQEDSLEPIDQTMLRESNDGIYSDGSSEMLNKDIENNQLDIPVSPVAPLSDVNIEPMTADNDNSIANTLDEAKIETNVETIVPNIEIHSAVENVSRMEPIMPIQNINETEISASSVTSNESINQFDNKLVDSEIKIGSDEHDQVDYKSLYDSIKRDNDVTNELLNTVMGELSKYKEKFGELEA